MKRHGTLFHQAFILPWEGRRSITPCQGKCMWSSHPGKGNAIEEVCSIVQQGDHFNSFTGPISSISTVAVLSIHCSCNIGSLAKLSSRSCRHRQALAGQSPDGRTLPCLEMVPSGLQLTNCFSLDLHVASGKVTAFSLR